MPSRDILSGRPHSRQPVQVTADLLSFPAKINAICQLIRAPTVMADSAVVVLTLTRFVALQLQR